MLVSVLSAILKFVGALAFLLWGMDMLGSGIQKGAGNRLQKLLGIVSGNRFTAVLTGFLVTAIIQSSSATTVMVVSFVNAQILSLTQAIGIIFGANIGTTITAWIVSFFGFSFSVSAFAIPLIGIGFFLRMVRRGSLCYFGDMLLGFGMLFLGLDLLGTSLPINDRTAAIVSKVTDLGFLGVVVGVLIGVVVTAIINSSSAFTAIVLAMAAKGLLTWELSAAMVIGSNIGTTADAVLASLGANTNAKRAAAVHVGFNTCGTILAIVFLKPLLALVDLLVIGEPEVNITNHIAMLHTVFNCCATLIYLPFVNQIAAFVTKLIKEPALPPDSRYKLPVIISGKRKTIDSYILQVEREIALMSTKVMGMLQEIFGVLKGDGEKTVAEVSETLTAQEDYVDGMNEEISSFLMRCYQMSGATVVHQLRASKLLQITSDLERLSDECVSVVHSLKKYMADNPGGTPSSYEKLSPYLEQVEDFFAYVCQRLNLGLTAEERQRSSQMEERIDRTKKELKKLARHRIEEGKDVKSELHYIDIVRHIERAGDCVYGIVNSL